MLKNNKKVQGVREEETLDCGGIELGALDVCPVGMACDRCPVGENCDNDKLEPAWINYTIKGIRPVNRGVFW